jgi:hypothetical protein
MAPIPCLPSYMAQDSPKSYHHAHELRTNTHTDDHAQEFFPEDEARYLASGLEERLDRLRGGEPKDEARAHVEVGDAYVELEHDVAYDHYQKALKLCSSLKEKDADSVAECYMKIGQVKMLQGDFARAVECLKRGGAVLDEVWREGSQSRVSFGAMIMYDLGVCYIRLNRSVDVLVCRSQCFVIPRVYLPYL